jgi:hypothetical protein
MPVMKLLWMVDMGSAAPPIERKNFRYNFQVVHEIDL